MKATQKAIDEVLEAFKPGAYKERPSTHGERRPVTLWLDPEHKTEYDKLQRMSLGTGRKFSDYARECLQLVIQAAAKKTG